MHEDTAACLELFVDKTAAVVGPFITEQTKPRRLKKKA